MKKEEVVIRFDELLKEIHGVNVRLAKLMDELEIEYRFDPYNSNESDIKKLWENLSKTRNFFAEDLIKDTSERK